MKANNDLISRSEAKDKILSWAVIIQKPHLLSKDDTLFVLDKLSTVDAVEVVRCKDCGVPHNKWTGCPNLNGLVPPPDFFCAKGERREENGN